jgi:PIN domain nuclease of toxin-antitoxin system
MLEPMLIKPIHTAAVDDLSILHSDPFDQLLLATARHEGMTLLTHDAKLADYGDFVLLV